MQLENKVALITGGTSGIGRATAELFAAQGARVAITGRRAKLGRQVAEATGGVYIQADHRRLQDCERVVRETLAAFGRIDILFNNAGIVLSGTAEGTSEQDWEDILLLNVSAVWRMSRLVIPILRAQGGGNHRQQCLRLGDGRRTISGRLLHYQGSGGTDDAGHGTRPCS